MNTRRRWWIVSGFLGYHYVDSGAQGTLCGIKLPNVHAPLSSVSHSRQQQDKLRCGECDAELKVRGILEKERRSAH